MSVPTTSKNAVAAGNAAPAAQATPTQTDLRYYLLLPEARRKGDKHRAAFEPFLREAEFLFALREAAIVRFRENRWLARRENAALPLTWEAVGAVLSSERKEPRAGLETTLARTLPPVLQAVFERLRKVLRRERELQGLGRVEQIDPTCLRWLTRQPGYTVAQKAGARQRVLAVVRREHYDLLENRVLRDLLLRTERLAERWLETEEKAFHDHESVKGVKRLLALCRGGLALEPLQGVSPLHEVPSPNYVLAQDALYRRVWDAYLLVVQYYRLVEDLWERRGELAGALARWRADAARYRGRFYRSELWVCPIKEGQPWEEDYPRFADETPARAPLLTRRTGDVTIDLLGMRLSDVLLVPDGRHPNAKPRLIDFGAPYVDFDPEAEEENRPRDRYLVDVLRGADKDAPSEKARQYLYAYFEQLHGLLGGERWTILVADNWTPEWLEAIRQAAVLAFGAQDRVFLLWRTIAYALGLGEPRAHVEVPRLNGPMDTADLEYDQAGRPCHRAFLYHPFTLPSLPIRPANRTLFAWLWEPGKRDAACAETLDRGAARFWKCRDDKVVPYWDERMGLYVVVQTLDEQILFKTLVEYSDRHPGGEIHRGEPNDNFSLNEQSGLELYLLESEREDETAQLKRFYSELAEKVRNAKVTLRAEGSPGQGLFRLEVSSPALRQPETLVLSNLRPATRKDEKTKSLVPETKQTLEYNLPRSFPPISPRVMASTETLEQSTETPEQSVQLSTWEQAHVETFCRTGRWFEAWGYDLFARATYRFSPAKPLPEGVSPLERLRRVNVFGAEEDARLPDYDWDFNTLFDRLEAQARREMARGNIKGALRLVAWTYQYDNPCFDELRERCIRLVVDEGNAAQVLISFCSNLCAKPEELRRLFLICRLPPADGTNGAGRQRLLYNLLMFHDDFVVTVGLVEPCPGNPNRKHASIFAYKLIQQLCDTVRDPETSVVYRNACLRSLIYLLRIRRYDGKRFAMKEHDEETYSLLMNTCRAVLALLVHSANAPMTWGLAKVLHRYAKGKGRLDDLLF